MLGSTEIVIDLGFGPAPDEEYDDVIPWDGKVYDLEDARVELPPKNAS